MKRVGLKALLVALALAVLAAACTDSGDGAEESAPDEDGSPAVPESTASPGSTADLRLVTLNLLHGLPYVACAPDSDSCQAADRLDGLFALIEDEASCPDVIGLQEIGPEQKEMIPDQLADLCEGVYAMLFEDEGSVDETMVLTSLPVVEHRSVDLSGPPWTAHWARLESDLGPVDFLTTHFASDSYNPDCTPEVCSPACPTGVEMGTCNAIEVVHFLDENADPDGVTIVTGDLNQSLDHPRIRTITDAGYRDVWLEAGNPECDPATGVGCTCCIEGNDGLEGLATPEKTFSSRIDFVLVRAPDACELAVDSPDDGDGDGTATAVFAGDPLDPPINGVYWASDHAGVQADLSCA
ncbi:MAG: hypothetical protein JJLCMIEE_00064 [Acidimicrobiales bacterium]|nr:hypothetical protein [Acidimicrobiales bacterium]